MRGSPRSEVVADGRSGSRRDPVAPGAVDALPAVEHLIVSASVIRSLRTQPKLSKQLLIGIRVNSTDELADRILA